MTKYIIECSECHKEKRVRFPWQKTCNRKCSNIRNQRIRDERSKRNKRVLGGIKEPKTLPPIRPAPTKLGMRFHK